MLNAALKIGQIGDIVEAFQIEKINYFSNRNFSDFEVLLVKVSQLYKELKDALSIVHDLTYEQRDAFLNECKTEFSAFLNHGGLVLLFVDQQPNISLVDPVGHFQVSKENEFSLMMLDTSDFELHHKAGKEFSPLGELEELHRDFEFKYQFLWDSVTGTPLFKPKRARGYAGFKCKAGNGWIYGLPEPRLKPVYDRHTVGFFVAVIQRLYDKSRKDHSGLQAPGWVEQYLIGDEQQYALIKKALEQERKALDEKIAQNEQQLQKFLEIKRLIFVGDEALEKVVEEVFRDLGFKVVVPEGNNDDLNILEEDFTAVVEIKGLTKSASTANGMQLEKWVSNYGIDNNVVAKGILIVNAFKDLAPKDRKEKPFPQDLFDYSTKREHCLMLTLDLLNIYVDFRAGLVAKEEIKVLLSTTVGILAYEPRFKSGQEK